MKKYELLDRIISNRGGIIKTSDAVLAGISKPYFYKYIKEREFEQAAHGIYISPDAWMDSMYMLHIRSRQVVFSHETALFLHDLTDREPLQYSVTVKSGYNPSRLTADNIKVYTVKSELYLTGLTKLSTPFGNMVRVYDMERTVCDIIRSRNNIEIQTLQDALKKYVQRKDKNLRHLMQYAETFCINKILNKYLEVLL